MGRTERRGERYPRYRPYRHQQRSPSYSSSSSSPPRGQPGSSFRRFEKHDEYRPYSRRTSPSKFPQRPRSSFSPERSPSRGSGPHDDPYYNDNMPSRECSPGRDSAYSAPYSPPYSPPPSPLFVNDGEHNEAQRSPSHRPEHNLPEVLGNNENAGAEEPQGPQDQMLLPILAKHCTSVLKHGLRYADRKFLMGKHADARERSLDGGRQRTPWSDEQVGACISAFGAAGTPTVGKDPEEDSKCRLECFVDCAKLMADLHHSMSTSAPRRPRQQFDSHMDYLPEYNGGESPGGPNRFGRPAHPRSNGNNLRTRLVRRSFTSSKSTKHGGGAEGRWKRPSSNFKSWTRPRSRSRCSDRHSRRRQHAGQGFHPRSPHHRRYYDGALYRSSPGRC